MKPQPGKTARPGSSRRTRKSGVIVPHEASLLQRFGAWLVFAFITAISSTLRYRFEDRGGFLTNEQRNPALFCVWHNRLALCLPIYRKYARGGEATPGMAAMASASKDGAFLAAIIRNFGVHPARGSSSRRGPQALLELTTWAERGYDLAITPDGPRGPCYHVQEGVVSLAQLTGLPILPCSYNLSWIIRVKSWDRFIVPLPFSKCQVVVGEPVFVRREAEDPEREDLRRKVEETLRTISKE